MEGTKAASVAGMPIGDKDEVSSRRSSKKGRFNVTAATMPLNRSSVNRAPPRSPQLLAAVVFVFVLLVLCEGLVGPSG